MNRLIILGASGHGKVISDIAVKVGYTDIIFLDDNVSIKNCAGYPVVGRIADAEQMIGDKIVAIGNPQIRERILDSLSQVITLIHPDAVISRRVEIGIGSVIMAGAIINSDTVVGKGTIINTSSSVDHDCKIADYCHISVGAHVAGTVEIGDRTWIGAGAIVTNNVKICSDCIVGAGAVIIKDINEIGTYVGVPARRVER